MSEERFPKVGDVITSPKFAYGYYNCARTLIQVDGKTKTEWGPYNGYDPSRAEAQFVVESADFSGGGHGHGRGDDYPAGWCVEARRLKNDGTYDPTGEVIQFYMTGCFTCMVTAKDIKIVGKMLKRFI